MISEDPEGCRLLTSASKWDSIDWGVNLRLDERRSVFNTLACRVTQRICTYSRPTEPSHLGIPVAHGNHGCDRNATTKLVCVQARGSFKQSHYDAKYYSNGLRNRVNPGQMHIRIKSLSLLPIRNIKPDMKRPKDLNVKAGVVWRRHLHRYCF